MKELIDAVAGDTGKSRTAKGEVINAMLDAVTRAGTEGDALQLINFWIFPISEEALLTGKKAITSWPVKLVFEKPKLVCTFRIYLFAQDDWYRFGPRDAPNLKNWSSRYTYDGARMISSNPSLDSAETAAVLPYQRLVDVLRETVIEYGRGRIVSPERMVVPLQDGGVMLSMPSSASDIAIHKLVNVCPTNVDRRIPTINGEVVAYDAVTGQALFHLDGPTVTGRRTAAVTILGIKTFLPSTPKAILIIGTGKQAANHVEALATLFPRTDLYAKGITEIETRNFVEALGKAAPRLKAVTNSVPDEVDVVVTVTTSRKPVYTSKATEGRLVIGVGAFMPEMVEIGKETIEGSFVVADDPAGARHEAGDLIQAGYDWNSVHGLADALEGKLKPTGPVFFKSVGCAAWDLAACRVARASLG